MNTTTLADTYSRLKSDPESSWEERRELARRAGEKLKLGEDKADALVMAEVLSDDPAWEVRQAVAELLLFVPEADCVRLSAKLLQDRNRFVISAAKNALGQRRQSVREVTRQSRMFEQVEADLRHLEKVHGPLAAKKARGIAERLCEHYMSIAVHNIRGVLTPITGNVQRLVEAADAGALDSSLAKQPLGKVTECLNLLQRMISDIKAVTVELTGEKQKLALAMIVQQASTRAQDAVRSLPEDVVIEVAIPDNFSVYVVREHVVTALANLIQNAIEAYMDRDGQIGTGRIVIVARELDGDVIELTIEDNGVGIHPDDMDMVFIPGRTTKTGWGTGYGLEIVRRSLEANSCSIRLEGQVNQGARAIVVLPTQETEEDDE